jgi:hypothetical protein
VTPAPVTVIKANPPCDLPEWPSLTAIDGTSFPNGAKIVDAKTGQTWDASPGSALLPKESLAQIGAYRRGTKAFYDASLLCRRSK